VSRSIVNTALLLDRILTTLRFLSSIGVWISGGLLLLLTFTVTTEILIRRFAGSSLAGVDELAGYALAIVAAFAFTETLFVRGHIRIDFSLHRVGKRIRALLDFVAMSGMIIFFGMIVYYGWLLLLRGLVMGTRSTSPLAILLWIPQSIWFFGMVLFVATSILLLLRALLAVSTGDYDLENRLIGAISPNDEISAELNLVAQAEGSELAK
jgi:TRAP-type C4-dicarboxylate transport system permease small subunit